jgi:hypothetical protein
VTILAERKGKRVNKLKTLGFLAVHPLKTSQICLPYINRSHLIMPCKSCAFAWIPIEYRRSGKARPPQGFGAAETLGRRFRGETA